MPVLPDDYDVFDAIEIDLDKAHHATLFDYLVATASGPLAQMAFDGVEYQGSLEQLVECGGANDAAQIDALALVLAAAGRTDVHEIVSQKNANIRSILGEARRIVEVESDWIESVALALEKHRSLGRAQVRRLRNSSRAEAPPSSSSSSSSAMRRWSDLTHDLQQLYREVAETLSGLSAVVLFFSAWAYAVSTFGWFLGLSLGWIPSIFFGVMGALLWPIVTAIALWLLFSLLG